MWLIQASGRPSLIKSICFLTILKPYSWSRYLFYSCFAGRGVKKCLGSMWPLLVNWCRECFTAYVVFFLFSCSLRILGSKRGTFWKAVFYKNLPSTTMSLWRIGPPHLPILNLRDSLLFWSNTMQTCSSPWYDAMLRHVIWKLSTPETGHPEWSGLELV